MKLNLDRLSKKVIEQGPLVTNDDSYEALFHLSSAYNAIKRLESKGIDIEFNGKPLILPSIERAFREVLHIRKDLPNGMLDTSIISKYGRLYETNKKN